MKSLGEGESPVVTVRVHPDIKARLVHRFPTRGLRAQWLRSIIEQGLNDEEPRDVTPGLDAAEEQTTTKEEGTQRDTL